MMSRPFRTLVAAFTMVLVCLTGVATHAQERLFLLRENGILAEVETADDGLGTVRRVTPLPKPPVGTSMTALAGGRYLVLRYSSSSLRATYVGVFDTRSFSIASLLTFPEDTAIIVDTHRPRLFYRARRLPDMDTLGVIEAPSFVPRVLRSDLSTFDRTMAYAETLNAVIYIESTHFATPRKVAAIDAATGELLASTTIGGYPWALLVDEEARLLHVPQTDLRARTEIQTYDLNTFALVNRTPDYYFGGGVGWSLDRTRHELLGSVIESGKPPRPYAFSLNQNLIPKAWVDFQSLQFNDGLPKLSLLPSTVRNRIFAVVSQSTCCFPGYLSSWSSDVRPGNAFLVVLSADTLQPLATVNLPSVSPVFVEPEAFASALLLSPPPPPSSLSSTVSDRRVTLIWRNPGDTTHFLVQVGTEPGRSNLATLHVGNVTEFTVENVPPGQYYVLLTMSD